MTINNNNVQVFTNGMFGQVRAMEKEGEIWFVAKDVAEILQFNETSQMTRYLDEDEKLNIDPVYLTGTNFSSMVRRVTLINESGLYSAVFKSRKPEAKQFKKWVTSEVLPSIRKHGAYMTENTIEQVLTSPDFLIQLATTLKEEQTARKLAEEQKQIAEAKIVELEPKAEYYDEVLDSRATFTTTQIAKDLGYSAQKLNYILNLMKVQFKVRGQWVLYSQYDGQGYTDTKTVSTGNYVSMQTVWTQKGRKFIIDKLSAIKNQYS